MFRADLILQLFKNSLIKRLVQRNYSLRTHLGEDAFEVYQSIFNIVLGARKSDFVHVLINFCVLVSWSKNKFIDLIF